jgi:Ca2+/Na+ antiporter
MLVLLLLLLVVVVVVVVIIVVVQLVLLVVGVLVVVVVVVVVVNSFASAHQYNSEVLVLSSYQNPLFCPTLCTCYNSCCDVGGSSCDVYQCMWLGLPANHLCNATLHTHNCTSSMLQYHK